MQRGGHHIRVIPGVHAADRVLPVACGHPLKHLAVCLAVQRDGSAAHFGAGIVTDDKRHRAECRLGHRDVDYTLKRIRAAADVEQHRVVAKRLSWRRIDQHLELLRCSWRKIAQTGVAQRDPVERGRILESYCRVVRCYVTIILYEEPASEAAAGIDTNTQAGGN